MDPARRKSDPWHCLGQASRRGRWLKAEQPSPTSACLPGVPRKAEDPEGMQGCSRCCGGREATSQASKAQSTVHLKNVSVAILDTCFMEGSLFLWFGPIRGSAQAYSWRCTQGILGRAQENPWGRPPQGKCSTALLWPHIITDVKIRKNLSE